MSSTKDEILHDHNHDGIDRRGFLRCMAWAGQRRPCVLNGGVMTSYALGHGAKGGVKIPKGELAFVQISDSHMGFDKPANPDVIATFQAAIDKINALPVAPEFILHTGEMRESLGEGRAVRQRRADFEMSAHVRCFLRSRRARSRRYDGQQFRERFAKNTQGGGWYSFEKKGVHFIGLVNVANLESWKYSARSARSNSTG